MPASPRASEKADALDIQPLQAETVLVTVIGTRPLICNRMSEKARHDILLPKGRKTAAEKQGSLKHDPMQEFRASPYVLHDDDAPTLIALMSSAFKGAMATAALDLPGARKAQIGRLVFVQDDYVPIYGKPEVMCSITRSADMNHTPDIRTRAVLPLWAAQLKVQFVVPLLNQTSIATLLSAAGVTAGVGDWRPEKGKGTYGQFALVDPDSPQFAEIKEQWGRDAQVAAMNDPEPYDAETAELLQWYGVEVSRRGFKVAS